MLKYKLNNCFYNSNKIEFLVLKEVKETDLDFTTYQKEVTVIDQ